MNSFNLSNDAEITIQLYQEKMDSHFSLVLVLEPLMQSVGVELQGSLQASFTLDLHDGVGATHHLDETHAVSQRQAAIGEHPTDTHRTEYLSTVRW